MKVGSLGDRVIHGHWQARSRASQSSHRSHVATVRSALVRTD